MFFDFTRFEKMTEEYKNYPHAKAGMAFDWFYMFPAGTKHPSGFGDIVIIGEVEGEFYLLTDWSDVIHFDGIGGYGHFPDEFPPARPAGWRIDLLPCGIFRIRTNKRVMYAADWNGSDMQIYAEQRRCEYE